MVKKIKSSCNEILLQTNFFSTYDNFFKNINAYNKILNEQLPLLLLYYVCY